MKIFSYFFLVFLGAVAATTTEVEEPFFNECTTTRQAYDAWNTNGTRIVTFGLSWCKKSWKSKFTIINYMKNSQKVANWTYHHLNCNKFAEGACKGLFLNFLDYAPKENKFMEYHQPRTFCIKREGKRIRVLPITSSGRTHSGERHDQYFFDTWMAKCNKM